jgi:hypothetical protein
MAAGRESLRRLDIPPAVIWTWTGTTDFVTHEVHADSRHARPAYWTIWTGDEPTLPEQTPALGAAEAGQLVTKLRESGADRLEANRVLVSRGYLATEHTEHTGLQLRRSPARSRPGQGGGLR